MITIAFTCCHKTYWASLVAQLVKNLPAMQETWVQSLGWEDSLEKGQATHSSTIGLPCGSAGKESACNAGDMGSIPELRRSPGGGNGNPLQYSCLENPQGQSSLVGYSSQGHKELDTTERLSVSCIHEVVQYRQEYLLLVLAETWQYAILKNLFVFKK